MRFVDINAALRDVAERKISERALLIFDPSGELTDAKPITGPAAREFWHSECRRRAVAWPSPDGAFTALEFDRGLLVGAERYPTKINKQKAVK